MDESPVLTRAAAPARMRSFVAGKAWVIGAGVVLALATWQVPTMTPTPGLDNSWEMGLGLAVARGLAFGRDVMFTYGPLGFLSEPRLVDATTGFLSLGFAAIAQVSLAAIVYAAAARSFGRTVGFVLAFLALCMPLELDSAIVYMSLFACVALLQRDDVHVHWGVLPAAGVIAAFELLVKLNMGLIVLVLFALTAWRIPPRGLRAEAVFAGSFVASLVALWVSSGNPVGDLPHWLNQSEHFVSSYSAGLAMEAPSLRSDYVVATVLVLGLAGLLVRGVRRLPRARQVALVALYAVFVYGYLKEGFVRHDGSHHLRFFGSVVLALLAFRWRRRDRWVAALLLVIVVVLMVPASRLYRPDAQARNALTQAADVLSSGRRQQAIAVAKARIRVALAVPPHALALLRGKGVEVVPYELSAIWAYNLRWQPDPLFQWNIAYDPYLDRLNADAIATRGAERVLRQRVAPVDGGVPEFEAPASYVALVCHYRQLTAGTEWQVLGRTTDRCAPARTLAVVHASAGQTVRVPRGRPGEMIVARIDLPSSAFAWLEAELFKPLHTPHVTVDGVVHRFIAATAVGPLLLRMPASAGFSRRFGGATSYDSLRLDRVPSPFTVTFQGISVS